MVENSHGSFVVIFRKEGLWPCACREISRVSGWPCVDVNHTALEWTRLSAGLVPVEITGGLQRVQLRLPKMSAWRWDLAQPDRQVQREAAQHSSVKAPLTTCLKTFNIIITPIKMEKSEFFIDA